MNTRVHKRRLIGLTSVLAVSIAVSAGYLARDRVGAHPIQAPHVPVTIVEIPAGAIDAPDPEAAAPIRFAPLPTAIPRPAAGRVPSHPVTPHPAGVAAAGTDSPR